MKPEPTEQPPIRSSLSGLEQSLIDEFVRARGCDPHKLSELPENVRNALLKEASIYSSARLTEVESRSHFVDEIHNVGHAIVNSGLE